MEKDIIVQLHGNFEKSVYTSQDTGMDFWLARDLQKLLGYAKWENFEKVVGKAKISCKNADFELSDHFLDIRKKVKLGFGAVREVDDLHTEHGITKEHIENNQEVRNLLVKRNIKPEQLPPSEDIKKVERRLLSEQKKLITKAEALELSPKNKKGK